MQIVSGCINWPIKFGHWQLLLLLSLAHAKFSVPPSFAEPASDALEHVNPFVYPIQNQWIAF
jgi:hypothetical protein